MATHRHSDINGYQTVESNPISKIGVYPYLGSEIGAPEPDKVYNVYRPAEELEKAAEMFRLMPIIDEHTWLGSETEGNTPAEKKGIIGAIGDNVRFESPYLLGNIRIFAEYAKKLIESGKKAELSPGYTSTYDDVSGEFDGQKYDYIQRIKSANHLALVPEGRTGKDVRVLDNAGALCALDSAQLVKEAVMPIEEILALLASASDEDKAKYREALGMAMSDEDAAKQAADEAAKAEAEKQASDEAAAKQAEDEAAEAAKKAADEEIKEKIVVDEEAIAQKAEDRAIAAINKRDAFAEKVKGIATVDAKLCRSDVDVAKAAAAQIGLKVTDSNAVAMIEGYMQGNVAASTATKTTDSVMKAGSVRKFYS